MKITISILAGGESRRMGRNKALIPFQGRPLIQQVVERIMPIADEIFISTGQAQLFPFLNPIRICKDLLPWRSSLAGLYTALEFAANPLVGAVACDMPFASPALFLEEARLLEDENMDIVIPSTPKGLEPLHAVYRKETCLPVLKKAVDNAGRNFSKGSLRVTGWFGGLRVRYLTPVEACAIDPSPYIYFNINTEEDLERAMEIACAGKQNPISVSRRDCRQ
jgi:molybdopterin-guanine dinucleotide biosynthesis protein A